MNRKIILAVGLAMMVTASVSCSNPEEEVSQSEVAIESSSDTESASDVDKDEVSSDEEIAEPLFMISLDENNMEELALSLGVSTEDVLEYFNSNNLQAQPNGEAPTGAAPDGAAPTGMVIPIFEENVDEISQATSIESSDVLLILEAYKVEE